MGQIISLTRDKCVINMVPDGEGGLVELEAPRTFVVGQAPDDGNPAVKAIKYNAHGNVWLRQPHYEITFADSTVKRIIPEDEVVDMAVDMANPDKKKKKATSVEGEPDLSAPDLAPVEEG